MARVMVHRNTNMSTVLVAIVVLVVLTCSCIAQQAGGPSPQQMAELRAYFESLKQILPPTASQQLQQIGRSNLPPQEKAERANAIFNSLPDSVIDRIPLPPPMRLLPQRIQQQLRALGHNHQMTFRQRVAEMQRIMQTMTPQERASIPGFTQG